MRFPVRGTTSLKLLAATALLALNAWIAWRLFYLEYSIRLGSIEGVYISLARYLRDHHGQLDWWPVWFCGMPFENTYQPLFHSLVALLSGAAHMSAARAYHFGLGIAYALGPVTLFALALRLTRSLAPAFAAGLLYSLISPSALLLPLVRQDLGSAWGAQRLHVAVSYADVPHMASLTLLPLAVLALDRWLERRTPVRLLLATLAFAAVPLTNVPGAVALGLALLAYASAFFSRVREWLAAVGVGLLGYLLTVLWMPPSALLTVFSNARQMDPARGTAWKYPAAALIFAAAVWAVRRARVPRHLAFPLLFASLTGAIVFLDSWFAIALISQPGRFHIAFEMALVLAAVFTIAAIVPRSNVSRAAAAAALTIFAAVQISHYRAYARELLQPIDMESRSEYKVARWLAEHSPDARTLAPGSLAFWLNAFADTPQVTGCCDQGILMPVIRAAYYGIGTSERDADPTVVWLQALGADTLVAPGPRSTEVFRDIAHPEKYAGLLVLWRDGDDIIYQVPRRSRSLAHVVPPGAIVRQPPENGIKIDPLLPYVRALEDPALPLAAMRWITPSRAAISATLQPGHVISVQVPHHPGWHARLNGKTQPIARDALGFMTIDPRRAGPVEISLEYDGGIERAITRGVTILAWIAMFAWIGCSAVRRARASNEEQKSLAAKASS